MRPTVKLVSPTVVESGKEYDFELEVEVDEPTKIQGIVVRLRGKQGWSHGGNSDRRSHSVVAINHTVQIAGKATLLGTSRYRHRFEVPRQLAPSHALEWAYSWLELLVRIEMAWWRSNHVYPIDVTVRRARTASMTRQAAVARSKTDSPSDARIEVAVASTVMVPGETIAGACAVYPVVNDKPHTIRIDLEPLIKFSDGSSMAGRSAAIVELVMAPEQAGTAIPFEIPIPPTSPPDFKGVTHDVTWQLAASARWIPRTARIPMQIVDLDTVAPPIGPVPRLGQDKVAALVAAFAEHAHWRPATTATTTIAIERGDEPTSMQLAYEYRGEAGTQLVARLRYPSLGLGLSVRPSSLAGHLFVHDVEIGDSDWDRAHHVVARSATQTTPFLAASALIATRATQTLGALVSWTDHEMVFERPIAELGELDLVATATALHTLDLALRENFTLISPPVDADLAASRELARWLDAPLVIGDLSIDGKLGTVPVIVQLVWERERATAVRVTAGDPERTSDVVRAVRVSLPTADTQRGLLVPEAVTQQLAAWPAGMIDLTIDDGLISAALPLGTLDAARIREIVSWACATLAALDPSAGPYR